MSAFCTEVDVCVISITVKIQVEVPTYLTKGGTGNRYSAGGVGQSPEDPLSDRGEGGGTAREGDKLFALSEVGVEPVQCGAPNSQLEQPLEEN